MTTGDAYDFYPCLVDDAPASIYVNLRFEHEQLAAHDTRYTVAIRMRDRGEHGIGTAEEAADMNLVEEAIIECAAEREVIYVGRVRTRGVWEIVLYGMPGHLDVFRALAMARAGDRRIDARSEPDATWRYYRELLLPDAERRQWMDDRRMVQILGEQGDRLVTPRRVDHRLVFPTPAARDAFVTAASAAGFTVDGIDDTRVRVHREDPIDLDHIHDVVMTLVDAARLHGGDYERWEAGIVP